MRGLGDFFRALTGNRDARLGDDVPPEEVPYKDYVIHPAPIREEGWWLTAGTISKEFPDGVREQSFIRGDRHFDHEAAITFSVEKAEQIIDLEGDRLFEGERA